MKNKPALLSPHHYDEPSVFKPENLLREARRQHEKPECNVPEICILDPDGDLVDYLYHEKNASVNACWAGYHTTMYEFTLNGRKIGIIGRAVGAPFAVLIAEQAFVSGCKYLISITSAGTIQPPKNNEQFLLIEQALRDEGTSFHYLPPDQKAEIPTELFTRLHPLQSEQDLSLAVGKSWTTDAPYRETQSAIDYAGSRNITAVEMEAAALYAFALHHDVSAICFAHLTNTMAQQEEDFEKGPKAGSIASLHLISRVISRLFDE